MIKKLLITTIVLFVGFTGVLAQENTTELQRAGMKNLESMVGQWKGSGWILEGSKRENFTGTETVQQKIDGLALLVEGKFMDGGGKIIHNTLAVLSYDAKNSKYNFRTYLANGRSGEHEFKLAADGFEWGFQTPAGTIRYTIKTTNDVWLEIGEFSKDGKTWMQFFEMKLQKVK